MQFLNYLFHAWAHAWAHAWSWRAILRVLLIAGIVILSKPVDQQAFSPRLAQTSTISASTQTSSLKQNRPQKDLPALEKFGQLPLRFEANQGQVDAQASFISRGPGYALLLTPNEAMVRLQNRSGEVDDSTSAAKSATVRMKLIGARPAPRLQGLDELETKSNYFIGGDRQKWRTGLTNYARVKYEDVYPGVDQIWRGNQRQLEHDFIVAPGSNPKQIKLAFGGVDAMKIAADGALVMQTGGSELSLLKPQAWQEVDGKRRAIACNYRINRNHHVEFRLGKYDRRKELVIDPALLYSTFYGGSSADQPFGVAIDKDRNIYVTGNTYSLDFPLSNPIQPVRGQEDDVFVLKLNASGKSIIYATWLGGKMNERGNSIVVDQTGAAYIAGYTESVDFPTTSGSFQPISKRPAEAFIVKLNPNGSSIIYSTFLGGGGVDSAYGLSVDLNGNAYLAGITDSLNLPATGLQTKRVSNGLYQSNDRAGVWNSLGDNLSTARVTGATFDPTNPQTIYVGAVMGLFKSIDHGLTWNQLGQQSNPQAYLEFASSIVFDPQTPTTMYVGSNNGGLYKSVDGGNTFQDKVQDLYNDFANQIYDILIDPITPNRIYAATNLGVYLSVNGGNNWQAINVGMLQFGNAPRVNQLAMDPSNREILYAATTRGLFKSFDRGNNWESANLVNGFVYALAIDPINPMTLYAGSGGAYKSIDGGATWNSVNNGLTVPGATSPLSVQKIIIDPATPSTIYAGTSAGVFKSTDGAANWSLSSSGLPNLSVLAMAIDRTSPSNLLISYNGGFDVFAAKLNAAGSALNWLTYLGGAENDEARGLAIDKDGNSYLTGFTTSTKFPTMAPFQATYGGSTDAFVAKLNPNGTGLIYSTYFGGSGVDQAFGVKVNELGQAFIAGSTTSTNLAVKNPFQDAYAGGTDAFVTKFNALGEALEYSTYLGGRSVDGAAGVDIDSDGNAYVTGSTSSPNFPILDPIPTPPNANGGPFVAKLNPAGSTLIYSTLIGGSGLDKGNAIALDSFGNAYVVGETQSSGFPTVTPVQPTFGGGRDIFISKIGKSTATTVSAASYRGVSLAPDSIAAIFGTEMSATTQISTSLPLPTTLGNAQVSIKLGSGPGALAPLFFVSPTQVNMLVPSSIPDGPATLLVTSSNGLNAPISVGNILIERVSPGLFSADSSGQGLAAAVALRIKPDSSQIFEPISRYDTTQNKFVAIPIDLSNSNDQVFLVLFGTGFRYRTSLTNVSVKIGGIDSEVPYAGLQEGFAGLDQLNVRLPQALSGRGEVDVQFIVDGKSANLVKVNVR